MAVHIFRAGLTGKLLFPEEILSYISFRSTTIYSTTIYLLKKKKRNQFISLWAGMENKNLQKAGKYHCTSQTSKGSEAGGVKTLKTLHNFAKRLPLWKKVLCSPSSCPNGEQLESKAMCTKTISKPKSMWQHRYDVFGLILGPLILCPGSAEGFSPVWVHWNRVWTLEQSEHTGEPSSWPCLDIKSVKTKYPGWFLLLFSCSLQKAQKYWLKTSKTHYFWASKTLHSHSCYWRIFTHRVSLHFPT